MSDKKTYTETVASIETHICYINNHLGNIDQHMEKINTDTRANAVLGAKNEESIKGNRHSLNRLWTITLSLVGGSGAVAGVLKILGVY